MREMQEKGFNTEKIQREYREEHRGLLRNEGRKEILTQRKYKRKYTQRDAEDCCAMRERIFNTEKIRGNTHGGTQRIAAQ